MMKVVSLILFLGLFSFVTEAQVVIGGSEESNKTQAKKKEKRQKKERSSVGLDAASSIYLVSNWSMNNRQLITNKAPYGDTLGFRANETSMGSWSFALGIRNRITPRLSWDGGVSFNRNGENYSFEEQDTSFSYSTTYQYIGMPFRLNFTFGKTVEFFGGIGVMPQLFSSYRQEVKWRSGDSNGGETLKSKPGYAPNSFVLSGLVNLGVCLHFEKNWSLLVSPELRYQFTSSYNKQDDFVHKNRAYGITFGLIRRLQ